MRREALSCCRAFLWSGMWFAGGAYVNRHLDALDACSRQVPRRLSG